MLGKHDPEMRPCESKYTIRIAIVEFKGVVAS